jgi:hypothetical protein
MERFGPPLQRSFETEENPAASSRGLAALGPPPDSPPPWVDESEQGGLVALRRDADRSSRRRRSNTPARRAPELPSTRSATAVLRVAARTISLSRPPPPLPSTPGPNSWLKLTQFQLRVLLDSHGVQYSHSDSTKELARLLDEVVAERLVRNALDGPPAWTPPAQEEGEGGDAAAPSSTAEPSVAKAADNEQRSHWPMRRNVARVFGMAVGIILPFIFGSPVLLATESLFRGTRASYNVLSERNAAAATALLYSYAPSNTTGGEVFERWSTETPVSMGISEDCGALLTSINGSEAEADNNVSSISNSTIFVSSDRREYSFTVGCGMQEIWQQNAVAIFAAFFVLWYPFWMWTQIVRTDRFDHAIEAWVKAVTKCQCCRKTKNVVSQSALRTTVLPWYLARRQQTAPHSSAIYP